MQIQNEIKLDFCDVLIRPKRSTLVSRSVVNIQRKLVMKHNGAVWKGIPIIAANMDTIGTVEMAKTLAKDNCVTALHKFYSATELFSAFKDKDIPNDRVFFTFGVNELDISKMKEFANLIDSDLSHNIGNDDYVQSYIPPMICIDVANGYFERFAETVKEIRDTLFKHSTIMVGNVATPEMVEALILAGADIIKIGIGPGSVCTTRKVAGVGYPQLSAIIECADAAHGMGGWICGDGGCVDPGDISKALGAGADFVMLGGMLAGHDECGGERIEEVLTVGLLTNGHKRMITGMRFYGMSSDTAMKKHYGEVASYRACEGKEVVVPYRGAVTDTISTILGGIRSTMTYIGAKEIKHMPKCTTFIRVNRQLNTIYTENK